MSAWTDTIQGVVLLLMILENRRQWRAIHKVRAAVRGEGDRG